MSDVTISYKNNVISKISESGSKSIKTAGKYVENDISITYVKPSSGISLTAQDEGKVVNNGELITQTARSSEITENGVYNTALNNSVTVNVSGGASISTDFAISENLIPLMTSNTTPSGVASASSSFNGNFAAYKAFNREEAVSSMQEGWLAHGSDNAPWLMYSWGELTKVDMLDIHAANNGPTQTLTLYIEGLTDENEWENMLANGSTIDITFIQNTYGSNTKSYMILTNGGRYKAFRIRGTESFYKGTYAAACTFSKVCAYELSGTLPGIGYYSFFPPSSNLGSNGNIYYDLSTGNVYQKTNGVWETIQ